MTMKLFSVVLLALALAACDSSSTPESINANRTADHPAATASPNTGANEQATPAPMAATPNPSQFKAGDKVKVKSNGSSSDATVVSVDEKLGKVTIKLSSGEEKTVALGDVTKQ
jgi:sRNA-binding protein